ncbi:hypothetical protein [Streptomyces sp. NPDC101165]|uniref:hypothetical protein n=1 Tax=Streptomyces sp. NPDC101165 TaxID=3366119 RepID=UPI0038285642
MPTTRLYITVFPYGRSLYLGWIMQRTYRGKRALIRLITQATHGMGVVGSTTPEQRARNGAVRYDTPLRPPAVKAWTPSLPEGTSPWNSASRRACLPGWGL